MQSITFESTLPYLEMVYLTTAGIAERRPLANLAEVMFAFYAGLALQSSLLTIGD